MRTFLFLLVVSLCLNSCKKEKQFVPRDISKVDIKTLHQDSLFNVRALETSFLEILMATSKGEFYALSETKDTLRKVWFEETEIDSRNPPNFRSLAYNGVFIFAMSIGTPSKLYKEGKLVYQENHPKAFYDAMDFWNDQEGIAVGDSTDGCLSVIITRDGGETWRKLLCDELPKGKENEGAFAASDTNIAIVGDKTWVATTAGRIYFSSDKGLTWVVYDTPIVKDKETEGIYSIDFYDVLNGFAIGGDYTQPDTNQANKIRTQDGGKTWELVAQGQDPGYRSCVQYIPNGEGQELVAIGFKGIDYSRDGGSNWKHLSDEGFYTIRFVNDSMAYAAGNGRISKLIFK